MLVFIDYCAASHRSGLFMPGQRPKMHADAKTGHLTIIGLVPSRLLSEWIRNYGDARVSPLYPDWVRQKIRSNSDSITSSNRLQ